MKLDAKAFNQLVAGLQNEVMTVSATLRDKGSKRFERPLVIALLTVVASYYLVFLPPQRKLEGLQRRIDQAKASSQNAEAYKEARLRLRAIYGALPRVKDKDHFLTDAVIETLRAEGLTSDSIQPPDEVKDPDSNVVYQQIRVSAMLKFQELVGWLARVEASKPFLHVSSVDITKSKRLGYCEVSVGVQTIVPTTDLTR